MLKAHHMTLWKDCAQAATLQHRLLPTDGYQWQGMAAQHRQGPMHSCSLPLPDMSYLTETKSMLTQTQSGKQKKNTPIIFHQKSDGEISILLHWFDHNQITLCIWQVNPLDTVTIGHNRTLEWFPIFYLPWMISGLLSVPTKRSRSCSLEHRGSGGREPPQGHRRLL